MKELRKENVATIQALIEKVISGEKCNEFQGFHNNELLFKNMEFGRFEIRRYHGGFCIEGERIVGEFCHDDSIMVLLHGYFLAYGNNGTGEVVAINKLNKYDVIRVNLVEKLIRENYTVYGYNIPKKIHQSPYFTIEFIQPHLDAKDSVLIWLRHINEDCTKPVGEQSFPVSNDFLLRQSGGFCLVGKSTMSEMTFKPCK